MYEQSDIQTTSIIQRRGVKARKLDIAELTGSDRRSVPSETDEEDLSPDYPTQNISCLFPEILSTIFCFLDVRSKGRVARVSRSWKDAAYRRFVWHGVEARLHLRKPKHCLLQSLVERGIKRVQVLSLKRGIRDIIIGMPEMTCLNLSGCYNHAENVRQILKRYSCVGDLMQISILRHFAEAFASYAMVLTIAHGGEVCLPRYDYTDEVTDVAMSAALTHELPCLTVLNVSLCKQITDSTLGRIANFLKNLHDLDVGGCSNITSNGLMLIAFGLKNLRSLNLRSCRHISDLGIEHLAGITRSSEGGTQALERLILQDCQKLTDVALKHISIGLPRLRCLNLSFCASVTDAGLRFLAKMPTLVDLNLRSCDNITDIGVGYLAAGGSRVTALDVSFCDRIGDDSMSHISAGIFHLRTLSVCACAVSDVGIEKLVCSSPELQSLGIGQCTKVTDVGLAKIAEHLKNLESIDLYGCTKITTIGMECIMKLQKLSTLNLGLWHKS